MKQFLYLNTDMVNSIIAQHNKGLILKITHDTIKTENNGSSNAIKGEIGAEGKLGIKKLAEIEANLEFGMEHQGHRERQKTMDKIYEKTLHDSAYDIAYEIIHPNIIEIDRGIADPGDYIELKRVFDFVDIDYIQKLFSEKGIMDLIVSKKETNLFREIYKKTNREQRRKDGGEIEKYVKTETEKKRGEIKEIKESLEILFETLPYNRLLFASDGYIIPVEDKYFRVNPQGLGFIYGGEIKAVGLITNIIGKDTNPNESNNLFSTIQFSINELIRGILPTEDDNLYVVTPIAIYYE